MPAHRPTRIHRRLPLLVLLATLLVGPGVVTATWQYDYLSCAYTACAQQPSIEGMVWWPANFSTSASAHSCDNERVLEGAITRSAPNGCWVPTYVRLWSEQSPQSHLSLMGDVNWSDPRGLSLSCYEDDVVNDYSGVC